MHGKKYFVVNESILLLTHALDFWFKIMSETRRATRESVQAYANCRNAISQNGVTKDLIASFLRDFESNSM